MDGKRREKVKKTGIFSGISDAVRESVAIEKNMSGVDLAIRAALVALGFLFAGTHTLFGAYPLGVALIAVLPSGVWLASVGVIVGSLALGKAGVVLALVSLLSILLRIIVSGVPGEGGEIKLFSESVPMRICSAALASSVASAYEILFNGLSLEIGLYALAMPAIASVCVLILSGAFGHGWGLKELVLGTRPVLFAEEEERSALIFKLSSLFLIFLISLSLKRFDIFGVNLGFVFAGALTLFSSLRFGALYGTVVGFVSSVGLSAVYSVAFALGGAAAGLLLPFGKHLAIVGACSAASLFGAYTSGASGFLSVLPEFTVASFLILPLVKYLEKESRPENKETYERRANDMVGTMALSYRNRTVIASERLESGIKDMLGPIGVYLGRGEALEDMTVFAKLLEDLRERALPEREMDTELTDKIEAVLYEFGLGGGVIRAFGGKRKYIILAARDRDGTVITSPALKRRLESASGYKLGAFDYYRRDEMAMMVCESVPKYKISSGIAQLGGRGEVSGDTAIAFTASGGGFTMLISDGMGSGEEAKGASEFVCDLFRAGLGSDSSPQTLIHMANTLLRRKGNECSATVDMFYFDTVTGESCFYKSGAASSFIKRKNSLYRIKSETMPLGIIKGVDAERIGAAALEGDTVISLSDGVLGAHEDSSWFVELVNGDAFRECPDANACADLILSAAKERSAVRDDMTVAVAKIELV